jgi:hypothetical protein
MDLQLDKAELNTPETSTCSVCKTPLAQYWELRGLRVCHPCTVRLQRVRPGTPSQRFWRAAAFGGAWAVIGFAVHLAVLKGTGMELGLISAAVGVAVGMAVRKGSRNMGGAGYQALAIGLTYLSASAVYYVIIAGALDDKHAVIGPLGYVLLAPLSLATPFFMLSKGDVLSPIILGFGLYEAWKFNRRPVIQFAGPFDVAPPAADGDHDDDEGEQEAPEAAPAAPADAKPPPDAA